MYHLISHQAPVGYLAFSSLSAPQGLFLFAKKLVIRLLLKESVDDTEYGI